MDEHVQDQDLGDPPLVRCDETPERSEAEDTWFADKWNQRQIRSLAHSIKELYEHLRWYVRGYVGNEFLAVDPTEFKQAYERLQNLLPIKERTPWQM